MRDAFLIDLRAWLVKKLRPLLVKIDEGFRVCTPLSFVLTTCQNEQSVV